MGCNLKNDRNGQSKIEKGQFEFSENLIRALFSMEMLLEIRTRSCSPATFPSKSSSFYENSNHHKILFFNATGCQGPFWYF